MTENGKRRWKRGREHSKPREEHMQRDRRYGRPRGFSSG